jgi:hypothetical protein
MIDYKAVYPELAEDQVAWCQWFESVSGFEVVFDDDQTFQQAQEWNLQWFTDWAYEAMQTLRRDPPPKSKTRKR